MRSEARRVGGTILFVSVVLGILLAARPLPAERLLAMYVLALAAIALAALTRLARPAEERRAASRFDEALRRRAERPLRPPELVRTERELVLGQSSAGHAHRRLLPLLREAAAARLATAHAVDLERRPEAAHALLGDDAWELLRPDRPEPADRHAPGIPFARVAAVVDRLERL